MDWSHFLAIVQNPEHTSVKVMPSLKNPLEVGPVIVDLANSDGGYLVIGFDVANLHLIGSKFQKDEFEQVLQKHCLPALDVKIESVSRNDKVLYCLTVPKGVRSPYFFQPEPFEEGITRDSSKPVIDLLRPSYAAVESNSDPEPEEPQAAEILTVPVASSQPDLKLYALSRPQESFEAASGPAVTPTVARDLEFNNAVSIQQQSVTTTLPGPNSSAPVITTAEYLDLNTRQQKAMQFVAQNQSIRNMEYRERFGISHKTAHIELTDLVTKGYLVVHGAGRSTHYRVNPDRGQQITLL